jgi:oligopeptide/dipeptide ABC transporter ATP-binding protein
LWVHLGLRGRSLRERVVDLLRKVRISDAELRVDSYPHQMSGGMRQRVAGAIAVSCQPSLLIADEPTTALDVTIQAQYLRLLKDIQRETNVGLIFVTHDLGIVAKLCDRVAVMYSGRIVESGTVREIFNSPRHPYTIGLLSCLPRPGVRRTALQTIPGQPPDLAHPPPGCHFNPRCALAEARCTQVAPELIDLSDGHLAACWRVAEAHQLLGGVPAAGEQQLSATLLAAPP